VLDGLRTLPPSPISYAAPPILARLERGERVDHRYDAGGWRVFESARLADVSRADAWGSVQRFPEIWSALATTAGAHRLTPTPGSTRDIDAGNVIEADAVVYGIRFAMRNVVARVEEGESFQLSVRAVGGRFESEVEARIDDLSSQTLLVWRQAYPRARLLSLLTAVLLARREADEARQILDRWAACLTERARVTG
jgi:hypothetical protein